MDLTCVPVQGTQSTFHCIANNVDATIWQPIATIITGALAVAAASLAYRGVLRQAKSATDAAAIQANGTLATQELGAKAAAERDQRARTIAQAAIRRQIAAYAYNTLSIAAHLIVASPFPTEPSAFIDVIQRLIDRLAALDTAEALDDETAAKALNEISYLQTGLYRLRRRWASGDKSRKSSYRLRVNAYRVFAAAEAVARALNSEDATGYAQIMRTKHAALFEPLEKTAATSRTQIR
jgi:hypothetical protein